jgi:hypothetical protein
VRSLLFCESAIYRILRIAMAKKKRAEFSAAKAVKANARERVGQPKATRVLPDAPKTGRKAKYKPKVDELAREEE